VASFEKHGKQWRAKVRKGGVNKSALFPTKALAEAWATREEYNIACIKAGQTPNKTLGDLLDEYAAHQPNEKPRIERLKAQFDAETRLNKLDDSMFKEWQKKRLKAVSEASVLRERKTLSAAFNHAINKLRWIQENPVRSLETLADGKPKKSVWTDKQIEAFCISAGYRAGEQCITDTSRVAASLLFALETAMRSSEICRATRQDITDRVLHIPKSKNGHERWIPLSQKALDVIAQLPEINETLFALGDASRDALFRKIRARAAVMGVDFHSARRTALTRLAKIYDVLTLAKISGHKDIRILLKHYYAPDMNDLAKKMDANDSAAASSPTAQSRPHPSEGAGSGTA
jgi:integrase